MSKFSSIPRDPDLLEDYITSYEQRFDLKPGTEACIHWHQEDKSKTEFALVYIHGFKATHPEGNPVHKKIAEELGCNMYLSRLEEHGYNSGLPLINLTEEKLLDSAYRAIEIGKRIGGKVIIMGTSTGGSLGLCLAASDRYKKDVTALVLYSPLIDFYGYAKLLRSKPLRTIFNVLPVQKIKISKPELETDEGYIWYERYAFQGALALGAFVQNYMQADTFQRINCPVFTGYYYRNEENQDKVVSVAAIKKMFSHLGTDRKRKKITNFPSANTHVICSGILSNSVTEVIKQTSRFLSSHCLTGK